MIESLNWLVKVNNIPRYRFATAGEAHEKSNLCIVKSGFRDFAEVIFVDSSTQTPGEVITSCPDRIVHKTTKVAICAHPDNRPPYFCGFNYCTQCLTGKWNHACRRGYFIAGPPREDPIVELRENDREHEDNQE